MKTIKPVFIILSILLFYGCAQMFNGVILPNQCKKCELIDAYSGKVLFTNEGCGSANTDLHGECQKKAWEISRGHGLCNFKIECNSWKKDK